VISVGEAKIKKEQFRIFKACVYCGKLCKPTVDHVPPKGIFPKPRPNDLITVPACEDCNGRASQIDEAFKTGIALQADPDLSPFHAALQQGGLSTLKKNRRLARELLSDSKDVLIRNKYGVLAARKAFLWPAKYHDEVVERTTKGLYFHETGKSLLELGCDVSVNYHGQRPLELPEVAKFMKVRTVGRQQFTYTFGIAAEDPRYSVWVYDFYGAHHASASTFPPGDPDFEGMPTEEEPEAA
jgi:hypothetical protein